jgi:peptidoglycan/LPS O-acetylase OafA/YrhL
VTSSLERTSGPDGSRSRTGTEAKAARLPSLTGMRFLCAAMVFGMHSALMGFVSSPAAGGKYATMVVEGGYVGVVYFFILSGFVLTWSAREGDRLSAFWRRRIVKIYPNYLVALVAGMVFTVAVQGAVFDRRAAGLDLLLLQSWSPHLLTRGSFNAPLWSLSAEALFYLSFPLLLRLINRVRRERLWAGAGIVVAAIVAVPVVVHLLPPGLQYPPFGPMALTGNEIWLVNQLPATRMLEFVLGIFMARIVLTGRRLPVGLGGAVALLVAAYWLTAFVPSRFNVVATVAVPLALVIAAAGVQDSAGRPSWVSGPRWVWLGEISFAFYLVHFLVLSAGLQLLGDRKPATPAAFGLLAVLFAVTTLLAWALHALVERPMMKHFSRSRRHRQQSSAPVPLPVRETDAEPRREAA